MSRQYPEPPSSEITPKELYLGRRDIIKNAALSVGTAAATGGVLLYLAGKGPAPDAPEAPVARPLPNEVAIATDAAFDTDEPQTPYRDVTTYNNFYEFGLQKGDPARNAHTLRTRPWTLSIEGEVAKPQTVDI